MQNIIDFLTKLRSNNNKEWFEAHKGEYKTVQTEFNAFVAQLIEAIGSFDSSVRGLQVKDCVYRIYRDVRFSKNKNPYKTHIGAFIAPSGRSSGNAGYYFHIEPTGANSNGNSGENQDGNSGGMLGGNILSAGVYLPSPAALKSIREDILYKSDEFLAAVARAEGFGLESYGRLKRVPTGYPADSPMAEYLKMRDDVSLYRHVDNEFLTHPRLLERVAAEYEKTSAFVRWLNRAIEYSKNN